MGADQSLSPLSLQILVHLSTAPEHRLSTSEVLLKDGWWEQGEPHRSVSEYIDALTELRKARQVIHVLNFVERRDYWQLTRKGLMTAFGHVLGCPDPACDAEGFARMTADPLATLQHARSHLITAKQPGQITDADLQAFWLINDCVNQIILPELQVSCGTVEGHGESVALMTPEADGKHGSLPAGARRGNACEPMPNSESIGLKPASAAGSGYQAPPAGINITAQSVRGEATPIAGAGRPANTGLPSYSGESINRLISITDRVMDEHEAEEEDLGGYPDPAENPRWA